MFFILLMMFMLLFYFKVLTIKDRLSKLFINAYLLWWVFWLLLSTFNVYGLYEVSDRTYLLLLTNCVMFFVGFSSISIGKNTQVSIFEMYKISDFKRSVYFKYLVFVNVFLLYYFLKFQVVVEILGGTASRMARFTQGLLFSNTIEHLFFLFIISSYLSLFMILFVYFIFYDKKKLCLTNVLLALSIFLNAGIGAGRGLILNILLVFFVVFFTKIKNFKSLLLKNKKILFIVILLSFFSIVYSGYLTSVRMNLGFSVENVIRGIDVMFEHTVVYFTGSFIALDHGIDYHAPKIPYFLGRGTFAGFDELYGLIISLLGVKHVYANRIISSYTAPPISIGSNHAFNYAYTNVFIHYLDFRLLGVILFPFLYGLFIRWIIAQNYKKHSIYIYLLLVYLFQTMIFTVFSWQLQSPQSMIIVCTMLYLHKKHIKKRKFNENSLVS